MSNTRIFFLCSFKKNEYKKFEINCMFRKEKKNKIDYDKIIPELQELGNDGEYLIKIGIVDFTKYKIENNNYLAFNIKVKANKKDYWTENKMEIYLSFMAGYISLNNCSLISFLFILMFLMKYMHI